MTAGNGKVCLAADADVHKLVSSCLDLNIYFLLLILGSYKLSVAGNAKVCLAADADVHKLVSSAGI